LDDARAYASDIGVLGVLRVLTRFRGLILLPIIARGLGAATYGAWTQSLVFVSVGMSVITLQFDVAVVRFVSGTDDRYRQRSVYLPLVLIVIGLGVLVSAAAVILAPWIASKVLGDPQYAAIAGWLGVWTALTAVAQLGLHLQRGLHRVKLFGVLSTAETLGQLAIVAGLILFTGELLPAVLGAVAWEAVFALAVLALGFRSVGLGWPDWSSLRSSLAFSLPLVPSYYGGTVLAFADRLFVAAYLGAEAVGIYSAAYSLARIVREIFVPISTALLPAVSQAWDRDEKDQARWLLANTLRYYLVLAIPAAAGLTILGPQILGILASGAIAQGVGFLIPFMAIGYLFSGVQAAFSVVLQLVQDTRALAVARSTAALLYVPMVILGVLRWGLLGGALATAGGYGLDLAFTSFYSRRAASFDLHSWQTLKAALASAGMSLVVVMVQRPGWVGLALSLLSGVAVYLGLLTLVGGIGRRELRFGAALIGWRGPGEDERKG